jgi:hypothetical protein
MTGDTAKGRSMSVMSALLPRNWNLVMAHAAATPNTTFMGTAIAATSSVSFTAAQAMGSVMAATYAAAPLDSACVNTTISGRRRKAARKVSAIAINRSLPQRAPPRLAFAQAGRGRHFVGSGHGRRIHQVPR